MSVEPLAQGRFDAFGVVQIGMYHAIGNADSAKELLHFCLFRDSFLFGELREVCRLSTKQLDAFLPGQFLVTQSLNRQIPVMAQLFVEHQRLFSQNQTSAQQVNGDHRP